jgi:Phage integrase, N-terminal SAM-like domain
MKGHVRERSPGRWAIVIDVRDPSTGKCKRRWYSFSGTKREAQVECARLITEREGGAYIDPARVTVAAFLQRWLGHIATQVSPRSHESYGETINTYIVPYIGNVVLSKLRPDTIAAMYTTALECGRQTGGGLSPRSVCLMHRVLSQAMKQAVKWQLLAQNPCDAASPPRVERKQMEVLDADGTAAIIEAARPRRSLCRSCSGPCVVCGAVSWQRYAGGISTWMRGRFRWSRPWSRQIAACGSNHRNHAAPAPLPCHRLQSRNCAGIGSDRPKNCCGSVFGKQRRRMFACNRTMSPGHRRTYRAPLSSSSSQAGFDACACTTCAILMQRIC